MAIYREGAYVAIKISVAEAADREMREVQIMQGLASHHPRPKHIVHLLDNFELKSPNGCHQCLVYELLGPNFPDTIDAHFPSGRLPGNLAKAIAKQSLIGLKALHQNGIGHGGTPPSRNILTNSHLRKIYIPVIWPSLCHI